jgi:hypothetical protein
VAALMEEVKARPMPTEATQEAGRTVVRIDSNA